MGVQSSAFRVVVPSAISFYQKPRRGNHRNHGLNIHHATVTHGKVNTGCTIHSVTGDDEILGIVGIAHTGGNMQLVRNIKRALGKTRDTFMVELCTTFNVNPGKIHRVVVVAVFREIEAPYDPLQAVIKRRTQ